MGQVQVEEVGEQEGKQVGGKAGEVSLEGEQMDQQRKSKRNNNRK